MSVTFWLAVAGVLCVAIGIAIFEHSGALFFCVAGGCALLASLLRLTRGI